MSVPSGGRWSAVPSTIAGGRLPGERHARVDDLSDTADDSDDDPSVLLDCPPCVHGADDVRAVGRGDRSTLTHPGSGVRLLGECTVRISSVSVEPSRLSIAILPR